MEVKLFGFVIITYNRPADTLALLQSISLLNQKDELLQEVIIVNNASTENYSLVTNFIDSNKHIPFHYIEATENLGVSKGRNFAISKTTAPILIIVDDDTVIQTKDSLVHLKNTFNQKLAERPTSVVAFKVLYADTLAIQKTAFPHKNFDEYKNKTTFETYYYLGGAHAIKKDVFEKVGGYPTDFFYGMEEYDLSFRILNAGFSIIYSDTVVLLHKESRLGRTPKKEQLQMMWINKSKVAWRYLPSIYFYSTTFLWSLFYLQKTRFDFMGFWIGWKKIASIPFIEKRNEISAKTLQYLKIIKARLWY